MDLGVGEAALGLGALGILGTWAATRPGANSIPHSTSPPAAQTPANQSQSAQQGAQKDLAKGQPDTACANCDQDPNKKKQTDKNKKAQARDPRIRSDLSDKYINDDGSLKWPDNNGAAGPETTQQLNEGQVVDKYGYPNGNYLSPQGTPFDARSIPYDPAQAPLNSYEVVKPFDVQSSEIAPWFDQPGGGTQFRTPSDINTLVNDGYLRKIN